MVYITSATPESTPAATDNVTADVAPYNEVAAEPSVSAETPVEPSTSVVVVPPAELPSSPTVDITSSSPEIDTSPEHVDVSEEFVTVMVAGIGDDILCDTDIAMVDGMSVYDALVAALDGAGVEHTTRGSGKSVYIKSIGDYSERSQGALSGWIYKVNGVQVSKGCSAYILEPSDHVSFYFSLDMGMDVANK